MNIEQTLTSMEVAEMVGKDHKNIMRDIRNYVAELGELKIEPSEFFRESTYRSEQNKTLPCYDVTKKGCEFIANKLTGIKGTEFTAKYINRFHDMEEELAIPQTTDGKIALLAQGHGELIQRIDAVNEDLQSFKKDMPVLALECEKITRAKNKKVVGIMGGKESNAYNNNSLRSKVYRDVDSQLRREFGINTYKAIKRSQCDKAIEIVENYQLPVCLKEQIDIENAQMRFDM